MNHNYYSLPLLSMLLFSQLASAVEATPDPIIPKAVSWSLDNGQLFIDLDKRFDSRKPAQSLHYRVLDFDAVTPTGSPLTKILNCGPLAWVTFLTTDSIVQAGDADQYAKELWTLPMSPENILSHLSGNSTDLSAQVMPIIDLLVAIQLASKMTDPEIIKQLHSLQQHKNEYIRRAVQRALKEKVDALDLPHLQETINRLPAGCIVTGLLNKPYLPNGDNLPAFASQWGVIGLSFRIYLSGGGVDPSMLGESIRGIHTFKAIPFSLAQRYGLFSLDRIVYGNTDINLSLQQTHVIIQGRFSAAQIHHFIQDCLPQLEKNTDGHYSFSENMLIRVSDNEISIGPDSWDDSQQQSLSTLTPTPASTFALDTGFALQVRSMPTIPPFRDVSQFVSSASIRLSGIPGSSEIHAQGTLVNDNFLPLITKFLKTADLPIPKPAHVKRADGAQGEGNVVVHGPSRSPSLMEFSQIGPFIQSLWEDRRFDIQNHEISIQLPWRGDNFTPLLHAATTANEDWLATRPLHDILGHAAFLNLDEWIGWLYPAQAKKE